MSASVRRSQRVARVVGGSAVLFRPEGGLPIATLDLRLADCPADDGQHGKSERLRNPAGAAGVNGPLGDDLSIRNRIGFRDVA